MRIVSTLFKVLARLVALVVAIYVLANGAAVAVGLVERQQVARDVTTVLARILPSAEHAQHELVDAVGDEPDRRWIEQSCEFGTDDSGWMVQNHRETCVLRSVSAWRVGSEQEARDLGDLPDQRLPGWDGCLPLGLAGEPGVVEGPEATYVDPAASDGEPWCTRDLGTARDARALTGERAALDGGPWLLLVAEQPLVDEPIGCAHWSVLFCDNPWNGHAFGDAPEE